MQISILVVRALAQELRCRRLPVEELCRRAGIDETALDDPTIRIPAAQFTLLLERANAETGDPHLGLRIGARTPTSALTVVGHLLTSCATLREAAAVIETYSPLIVDGATWSLSVDTGIATQRFALAPEFGSLRAFGADLAISLTWTVIRSYSANARLTEVTFEREASGDARPYEAFFEAPVRFGADANAVRYPAELLDRRQLHTDLGLHEMLQRRADAMLSKLRAPEQLADRVRRYLVAHPQPSSVTIGEIAHSFSVPERTLRRRLVETGPGFRELFDTTLRDLAITGLTEGTEVKAVAFRLGFADVSSFHRAFKRWTGVTPADYRDRVAARS